MILEQVTLGYWILLLLIGIVFGFVGYLLGKKSTAVPYDVSQFEALKSDNAWLKADLKSCQEKSLMASKSSPEGSSIKKPTAKPAFDTQQVSALMGRKVKKDDLKVIEGIGPKIEQLFHAAGIPSWEALAAIPVKHCQEILDAAGPRYKMHDPSSWPMQAKMCAEGKWKELVHWQEDHKHGKY